MTIRRPLALLAAAALALGGVSCGDDAPDSADRPADLDAVRGVFADELADLGLRLTDRGGVLERDGYVESPTGTHLALYVAPTGAHSEDDYAEGILTTARLLAPEVFSRWSALESFDVCQEQPGTSTNRGEPHQAPFTHLALYVAPTGAYSEDDYAEGILTTARLLAPEIFSRWSALESFDVCQEQPGTHTIRGEPDLAPFTQLDMSEDRVQQLDWASLTLAELLAFASKQAGEGIRLYVADPIQESAAFVEARTTAGLSP